MKLEDDFRMMSDILRRELLDVKEELSCGQVDVAQEKYDFVARESQRFETQVLEVDGSFRGLSGIIFRQPYHVPKEILADVEYQKKALKQVQQALLDAEKNKVKRKN